jgi:hypothetical protein
MELIPEKKTLKHRFHATVSLKLNWTHIGPVTQLIYYHLAVN